MIVTGNPEYLRKDVDISYWRVLPSMSATIYAFFLRRNKVEHWAIIDKGYYYTSHDNTTPWLSGDEMFLHVYCPVAVSLGGKHGTVYEGLRCMWCHRKVHRAMRDLQLWRKRFGPTS